MHISLLPVHATIEIGMRAEVGRDGSIGVPDKDFAGRADAGLRVDEGLLTVTCVAGIGAVTFAVRMDRVSADDGRWITSRAAIGPPTRLRLAKAGVDGVVDCGCDGRGTGNSGKEHCDS